MKIEIKKKEKKVNFTVNLPESKIKKFKDKAKKEGNKQCDVVSALFDIYLEAK